MDASLATLIILYLQLLFDKFPDVADKDTTATDDFIDNILVTYCAAIDDPGHLKTIIAKVDEVCNKWTEIRDGVDEQE